MHNIQLNVTSANPRAHSVWLVAEVSMVPVGTAQKASICVRAGVSEKLQQPDQNAHIPRPAWLSIPRL